MRQNGGQIDRLKIFAVLRDWSWRDATKSEHYPKTPIIEWNIRLMNDDMIEDHMRERIALHERAKSGATIQCTDEDRWAREPTFALRKVDRKGAVKVQSDLQDLHEYAEKKGITISDRSHVSGFGTDETIYDEYHSKGEHYTVERMSEQIRCARYCPVVQYCEQAKSLDVVPTMRAYGRT